MDMKQEHHVPTQSEVDSYIAQAKILRGEALASQGRHLFRLPSLMMERFVRVVTLKKPTSASATGKGF